MDMIRPISLIIPSHNDASNLMQLLKSIPDWEIIPSEIIIVDSSDSQPLIPKDFVFFTQKLDIKILVLHEKNLYPGHARNIGINNATSQSFSANNNGNYAVEVSYNGCIDTSNCFLITNVIDTCFVNDTLIFIDTITTYDTLTTQIFDISRSTIKFLFFFVSG